MASDKITGFHLIFRVTHLGRSNLKMGRHTHSTKEKKLYSKYRKVHYLWPMG
jgi:hypothetical protein